MAILKCKMCGGDLTVTEGIKIVECDFCGTTQTIPNADDEKKTNLFNRANRLRIANEFDRAAGIYESIIAEFPTEAEAYWGLCLCKYGIEYVDDPKTAEKIPTCHRTSFESIFNDGNYNQAISYSDSVAKGVYESEAKAIDALQKDILSIVNKEKPFDVFICYKETDELGNRTVDSVLAQDIYDHLTDRGFKVFFARITLEDKLGQEYEPYIFAALNSAKVMLAIGTNSEYYNAVWVKNEWSRYLSLMHNDRSKTLVPCYRDVDPYDMPPEFKNLQGQDMGKLGFIQDLTRGITKIIRGSAEKVEVTTSAPTGALTKRGYFFLEDGDFKSADEYFDKALDENPEDSKAYAGKVLAGLHMCDVSEIDDNFVKLYEDKNFERAIRFSSGADKAQLEDIKENADRKWFVKCLTVGLTRYVAKKETDELKEKISGLAANATAEAYDEIIRICDDAYTRKVNRSYFSSTLVENAKMQAYIIRVLADGEEHTSSDIKESKYFSGQYVPDYRLEARLKEMVEAGSVEIGLSTGSYCIIGAAEKRKQKQIEDNYARAEKTMTDATNSGDYQAFFSAAELYDSISDFRDSASKSAECKQLGEKRKAEIEAERARQEALRRQELARQEAERKAAEEKRLAEIKAHNDKVNAQISTAEKELAVQKAIYAENAGKIFGAGAKLKKAAKAEIARLETVISDLKRQLK